MQAKGADSPIGSQLDNGDGKAKLRRGEGTASKVAKWMFSPVLVEAFVLTFLAEWGDRSQIATIGAPHGLPCTSTTCGLSMLNIIMRRRSTSTSTH